MCILIGLATSIKLTPAIFSVYLFLTHRNKAGIIAILTVAITIILGFLILPVSSYQYWNGLFLDTNRIGDVRLIGEQSLNGMLSRIFGSISAAKPLWFISSIIVGFSGLSLASYASRNKKELLGILICAITGLLISPLSWSHHWVWLSLLLIFFLHQAYPSPLIRWVTAFILFIICGWLTPLIPNLSSLPHIIAYKPPKVDSVLFIQQNPYVLIGIIFLIASTYSLFIHKKNRV